MGHAGEAGLAAKHPAPPNENVSVSYSLMCRLVAYLGPPLRLDRLLLEPEHSLLRQTWMPQEMREAVLNADGYGLGWYTEEDEPATYRCTLPMWADDNLHGLAVTLHSRIWLANARSATPGQGNGTANTQPFVHDGWMYLHNGYLQDFNPTLRAEFHRRLPAEALATLGGTTDSEYLFALIRHHLHAGDGRAAIRAAWAALAQMTSGHRALLNVVLYDRQRLIACRHALHGECPSLYYRLGVNGAAEAALVASERLDDDPAWREVAAHHLLVMERDGSVTQAAL